MQRERANVKDLTFFRPLSSVEMHSAEDIARTGPLAMETLRFADARVKDFYGLSLTEFFALPHDHASMVIEDSEKRAKANLDALTAAGADKP